MRILVVSNLYPPAAEGGYERRCADTVAGLSHVHEFFVLTSSRGREQADDDPRVRRDVRFLRHRRLDSVRAPLAALGGARAMRAALADWRPDLIFVWNADDIPHSALWVAQQSGVPIAFHVAAPWLDGLYTRDRFARHLSGDDRGVRRAWAGLMRLVNRAPSLRIVPGTPLQASVSWVSEATRMQSPAPAFLKPTLARVIYPSTRRCERFAAAAPRRAVGGGGGPLIAFAGRLEEQKGPDIALRALAHLAGELGVPARLELAGPGAPSYRRSLERLAVRLRIADRVIFHGPLELDGVIDLFARADVVVIPSVWQEPFGMVLIEAALTGAPVVASLSGGMPEALRPELEALYFPIGDWRACAAALADTLGDHASTAARVERARRRAASFAFDAYLERMADFVERSVESERDRSGVP
jgi:glycosyltransferase involved in cell wall biosynthesis